jgi:hypothetical protein
MGRTWQGVGMGCALLWASACGVAPEEGLPSQEAALRSPSKDGRLPPGAGLEDKLDAPANRPVWDGTWLQHLEG